MPNTTEAREAALRAQIPHLATVSRTTASAPVSYDGAPQFAPIDGTALSYAVNTPNDVIRVGDAYYLCQNGVWFTAASPTGPWSVATAVPDQIYAIPPSSPVYNVTYVKVYQVGDDTVVNGYTDGYLGEYVADGVVTWGTGYYYAPYIAVGAVPYYSTRVPTRTAATPSIIAPMAAFIAPATGTVPTAASQPAPRTTRRQEHTPAARRPMAPISRAAPRARRLRP